MQRTHQPDEGTLKAILPEQVDRHPFPAFPPDVRLAVLVGQPSEPGHASMRAQPAIRVTQSKRSHQ